MAVKDESAHRLRRRILVTGTVQGVGFRPHVFRLARRYGLAGWVCNTSQGVLIEAEGAPHSLTSFEEALVREAPPLARVADVRSATIHIAGDTEFRVRQSVTHDEVCPVLPADVSLCDQCAAELRSPANRRYGYPFTNCTNCGPRFTIVEAVPYDRRNTTMSRFVMCESCQKEYDDPNDRRFHAQPNACPVCGPHLTLDGSTLGGDANVIERAALILREGKVLAVKGLGGYHLACDARNTAAVSTLRIRKGRVGKPFAVMCADMSEVRRICHLDALSEELLRSPEKPIVLLPARPGNGISPQVAPGMRTLGVMLPYTPLHELLMSEAPRVLVMTSGNLSEEPLEYRDDVVVDRLGLIADHILSHDRPIAHPCDDSVVNVADDTPMVVRRARGYVPRPIEMHFEMPCVLACGGDLKSTFCFTRGKLALLSQHLGDLENALSLDHYTSMVRRFQEFFDFRPEVIAHDLHPDYASTRFAQSTGLPGEGIQHHHAHVASCLAEHRLDGPVIGVAFDGMGYGLDGNSWGSEFLTADLQSFRRAAHLIYVPQPGGDAAVRRPGRMAFSYLLHSFGDREEATAAMRSSEMDESEKEAVFMQIERRLNAPLTCGMGRLFDAVSALVGVCDKVTYEAQAAIELEQICEHTEEAYPWSLVTDVSPFQIDVRPMIRRIVEDVGTGVEPPTISGRFHSTIADIVVGVCVQIRDDTGLSQVALSGGVFQNRILLEKCGKRLRENGFEVLRHSSVPCNDGGLSLGQAAIAARRYMHRCV